LAVNLAEHLRVAVSQLQQLSQIVDFVLNALPAPDLLLEHVQLLRCHLGSTGVVPEVLGAGFGL